MRLKHFQLAELNRIASHLVFIGSLANDLGAVTGMIYAFRDREKILDLFDLVCGARMTFHYIRVGGVSADLPPEFAAKCDAFLKIVPLDDVIAIVIASAPASPVSPFWPLMLLTYTHLAAEAAPATVQR